jgi:hypothetical protein
MLPSLPIGTIDWLPSLNRSAFDSHSTNSGIGKLQRLRFTTGSIDDAPTNPLQTISTTCYSSWTFAYSCFLTDKQADHLRDVFPDTICDCYFGCVRCFKLISNSRRDPVIRLGFGEADADRVYPHIFCTKVRRLVGNLPVRLPKYKHPETEDASHMRQQIQTLRRTSSDTLAPSSKPYRSPYTDQQLPPNTKRRHATQRNARHPPSGLLAHSLATNRDHFLSPLNTYFVGIDESL